MSLSTSCLFHFTKKIEVLCKVLNEGLKYSYCYEEFKIGNTTKKLLVPMISFCDIPLSQAKEHIGKYGSYGIGLSKDKAQLENINPVLYLDSSSLLSNSLKDGLIQNELTPIHYLNKNESLLQETNYLLGYIKNHKGVLKRRGKLINKNYKFIDEREWRIVPLPKDNIPILQIDDSMQETEVKRFKEVLNNNIFNEAI